MIEKTNCTDRAIIWILTITAFSLPFGAWQDHLPMGITIAQLAIPMACLIFLASLAKDIRKKIYFHPSWFLYAGFLALTLPTIYMGGKASLIYVMLLTGYAALIFCAHNTTSRFSDIRLIIKGYALGLTIILFFSCLSYLRIFDLGTLLGSPLFQEVYGVFRLLGTELNPNAFAVYFITGLPAAGALFVTERTKLAKVGWLLFMIICFLGLCLTFSRSAMLGSFFGLASLWFLQGTLNWRRTLCFIILMPICVISAFKLPTLVINHSNALYIEETNIKFRYRMIEDKEDAIGIRLEFLPVAIDIIKNHPLTGIKYGELEPILEPYDVKQESPHNIFLDIAIYFGIPALLFFCGFLTWALLASFFATLKIENKEGRIVSALLLSITLGNLINGVFHSSHYNSLFWLIIALMFASLHLTAKDKNFSFTRLLPSLK